MEGIAPRTSDAMMMILNSILRMFTLASIMVWRKRDRTSAPSCAMLLIRYGVE